MLGHPNKVYVKNSTFPKLGRYGFCKSSLDLVDFNHVHELDLTNVGIEEIHEE